MDGAGRGGVGVGETVADRSGTVRIHCVKYLSRQARLLPLLLAPPRSPDVLLPAAAGLLRRLLHLRAASVPGPEERRAHAHCPQGAHHGAGPAGLLGSVQLRPPGQVDAGEDGMWRGESSVPPARGDLGGRLIPLP